MSESRRAHRKHSRQETLCVLWSSSCNFRSSGTVESSVHSRIQAGVQGLAAADPTEVAQEGKGSAAQCQLPLLPVTLIDEALSCSIKQLWRVICKPDPAFQATIHRLSGNRDIQYGDWQQQGKYLPPAIFIAAVP